jgi:deoxyribonuclease-4
MSTLKKIKRQDFLGIGFHVKRGPDMLKHLDLCRKKGFDCFQIFANSPRQMLSSPSQKVYRVIDVLADYIKETGIRVYIHSPYTINLSNAYYRTAYWNTALIQELEMAERIGASGVVIHTGRYKEQDKDVGIMNMVANISYCVQMAKSKVPLLIETPSGQGTELGVDIEELAKIWKAIPSKIRKRLGICIDTCHIFAAGYDLRKSKNVDDLLFKFDNLIGLKHLKLVHLNDSRMGLGSRLDRHAELLKGEIGKKLGIIVKKFYKLDIPIIVETPGDLNHDIKTLTNWIV